MFSDNTECEILFGIPSSDTICTINFYGCRNTNFHCFQHQEHKDIHQENLSVVVCLYSCMPNFFFVVIQSYFLDITVYLAAFFYSMVLCVKSTLDGKINKWILTKTALPFSRKRIMKKNLYKNHMLPYLQLWLKIYSHWTALASSCLEDELQIFTILIFSHKHPF